MHNKSTLYSILTRPIFVYVIFFKHSDMKKYIILIFLLTLPNLYMIAQDNYKEDWKKVEAFEQQGLPKSAIDIVKNIYAKAKKQGNPNQAIKALLHKAKFMLTLEEDAQLNIILELKNEIEKSKFPTRNILESILAKLYWQYFEQNRWKFYSRTQTAQKVNKTDFRTWDLKTIFAEIHLYYQKSLQNGVLAQQTELSSIDELLTTAKDSKKYRPTLYDFLSHNALSFYKTSETDITKPSYAFRIDNPEYLSDHKKFSAIKISTNDTTSLQFHALKIYQNLIKFHSRDKQPDALTEINIERLNFVLKSATFNDKQKILIESLQTEKETYKTNKVSALYDFEIANIFIEQASSFIPIENEENRWKLKDAVKLYDAAIAKFPDSRGANNCKIAKNQILQKVVNIQTEKYIPTQANSKILVTYKNTDLLYFKALQITQKQLKSLNKLYKVNEQITFINALNVSTTWDAKMRNEQDYQTHSSEILLPKLKQGSYLILASPSKELTNKNKFSYGSIQVSDLTLIENKTSEKTIFQVVNRNNGFPIPNATVNLFTENQRRGKNDLNKTITTDKNGEANFITDDYYYNVSAIVKHENDTAQFDGFYLNKSQNNPNFNNNKARQVTFLFTDRSIYRPGQTLYFKGILMISDENPKVIPNQEAFATLRDGNGQIVKTLNFKTNEYGSFSGEFIIPSSGLTGIYTIQTNNHASTSVSVEEYKRPKFETVIEPITKTYKINDNIPLNGTAKAYAGSSISEAKVVYRVHRKVQYPIWCYWYPPHTSQPQEITHGETKTNDKGEYKIDFKAIPDPTISKEDLPIFNYEVNVDVTDINGETRSTSTIINVGYHSLIAIIENKNRIDKTKNDFSLSITTKNLNNEFVSTNGTIQIFKLKAPVSPLRTRPWKAPDYKRYEKSEFKKLFPHDAYSNENDYRNWEKGELKYNNTFNTQKSETNSKGTQQLNIEKTSSWESGKYIIELHTKDRFGQEVKDIKYVTLYSPKDKNSSDQQILEITTNQPEYSIGDNAIIKLSSASKDITITIDIEKNHKIIETKFIKLSENSETFSVPITKEDLGGFSINYNFVNYNSHQNGSILIPVPYHPTELSIETKSFRNKLQPNEKETWSFTIKGPKGDKITAELLASMYDASLDQFKPHQWSFIPIKRSTYSSSILRHAKQSFGINIFNQVNNENNIDNYYNQQYDQLNWHGLYFMNQYNRGSSYRNKSKLAGAPMETAMAMESTINDEPYRKEVVEAAAAAYKQEETIDKSNPITKKEPAIQGVKIRKNFQETAFFFPHLTTDAEGNVSFNFTAPEALTKWKLQLLSHTKTLNAATQILEVVTQKELMLTPNPPRFLREGDNIVLSSKISNLSSKDINGVVELQLFDALTNKTIDLDLKNTNPRQNFEVKATGNTNVIWSLKIPDNIQAVQYKIVAKGGKFSDGEQNTLPVLTNRKLVTETLPMWIHSNQTKNFSLDKLKNNNSNTLKNHKLTLEITSNPAWYAIQALPYLIENQQESSDQIFSRYYANVLASHIANSNPRIQEVFTQWKSTDALLSNLEKNQELKSIIIQETPWLRDAQSETEQKKRIALLFDLNKMNTELQSTLNKLQQMQYNSGAFPWFIGGRENRFISQYIASGFGHLQKLNISNLDTKTKNLLQNVIRYLDQEFVNEYEELKKYCDKHKTDITQNHLSHIQIHYLYMRSFFPNFKLLNTTREASAYYIGQAKKYWTTQSLYAQGMLSLILHRNGDTTTATKILRSLDEKSITNEELGMYWKSNTPSWHWYQAPVETQSLMIEVFAEIEQEPKRTKIVDNLKVWLLKNKQTNQWRTTKATSDAVYALLLQGSDWLSVADMVEIELGDLKINPNQLEDVKVEVGTGYFKTSWHKTEIKPSMATAKITKKGKGIAWGALYWQYFENLDKITSAETPLKLKKKLFLKKNSDTGEKITEVTTNTKLQLGDVVRVRIELQSDRAMEFIHMKDMRASGLEPINVISQYKSQDGLGYYESTRDVSTNFFFDYLPKGIYVFEYDLRVNNEGDFSNGITTIQSMYAPEFSSHSEGLRILVPSH